MTQSPGSDPSTRPELAPPHVTSKPVQRTGYAVVAASGLVLATAFGAIASMVSDSGSAPTAQYTAAQGAGSTGGGPSEPGGGTRTIDGVAVAQAMPDSSKTSSSTPTTKVTIGADGKPTTTVITPPNTPGDKGSSKPGDNSSRSDDSEIPGTSDNDGGTTSPSDSNTSTPSDSDTPPTSSSGGGGDTSPPDSSSSNPSPTTSTGTPSPSSSDGGAGGGGGTDPSSTTN